MLRPPDRCESLQRVRYRLRRRPGVLRGDMHDDGDRRRELRHLRTCVSRNACLHGRHLRLPRREAVMWDQLLRRERVLRRGRKRLPDPTLERARAVLLRLQSDLHSGGDDTGCRGRGGKRLGPGHRDEYERRLLQRELRRSTELVQCLRGLVLRQLGILLRPRHARRHAVQYGALLQLHRWLDPHLAVSRRAPAYARPLARPGAPQACHGSVPARLPSGKRLIYRVPDRRWPGNDWEGPRSQHEGSELRWPVVS
jgi:hypothetical protein